MLAKFLGAGVIVGLLSVAANACMEPPDITHRREMGQLADALKTSKRPAADVADARRLQKRADTLYKAGKWAPAVEARHAALIKIGFKLEVPPAGPTARSAVPPVAALPTKSKSAAVAAPTGGCGNADHWIEPGE